MALKVKVEIWPLRISPEQHDASYEAYQTLTLCKGTGTTKLGSMMVCVGISCEWSQISNRNSHYFILCSGFNFDTFIHVIDKSTFQQVIKKSQVNPK